jgi:hypothetical protein
VAEILTELFLAVADGLKTLYAGTYIATKQMISQDAGIMDGVIGGMALAPMIMGVAQTNFLYYIQINLTSVLN